MHRRNAMNEEITFFAVAPRPRERIGIDEELTAMLKRRIVGVMGRADDAEVAAQMLGVAPWRLARWLKILKIKIENDDDDN